MSTVTDPEQGMSINEVAALLGVSRRTVRRRINDGSIPMHKVGHLTRLRREDVLRVRIAVAPQQDDAQPTTA